MITIVTTRATERAGINAEEVATAAVLSATTLSKFGSAVKKYYEACIIMKENCLLSLVGVHVSVHVSDPETVLVVVTQLVDVHTDGVVVGVSSSVAMVLTEVVIAALFAGDDDGAAHCMLRIDGSTQTMSGGALLGSIVLPHSITAVWVKVPVRLTFDNLFWLMFSQSSGMFSQEGTPSQIGDVKEWFEPFLSP